MNVIFTDTAYSALLAETYEKIRTETGGVFLGCYQNDTWYVIETLDPGPKSVFRQDYFEYDQPYTAHLINKRARLYEQSLTLIGLWHRHPGSFDIFSSTDDKTNATYAAMHPEGAISLLVNIDPVFRLSVFHVKTITGVETQYTQLRYQVGDELVPHEMRRFKHAGQFIQQINCYGARQLGLTAYITEQVPYLKPYTVMEKTETDTQGDENIVPLFPGLSSQPVFQEDNAREVIINSAVDDLSYLADVIGFKTTASWVGNTLHIHEGATSANVSVFSIEYDSNHKCCLLCFGGQKYYCQPDMFSLTNKQIPPAGSYRRLNFTNRDETASSSVSTTNQVNSDRCLLEHMEDSLTGYFKTIWNGVYRFLTNLPK